MTAYVACEVSCGNDGATRDCVSPLLSGPGPGPGPGSEPELATELLAAGAILLLVLVLLCAVHSRILNALGRVPEKWKLPEASPPKRDGDVVSTCVRFR